MRKGLLSFIYVVFFFTVGGAVLAFNFQNEFTGSPENLKTNLRQADIYSRLTHINAKDLEAAIDSESRDPESEISSQALQQLISKVSPATLESTVENGLDLYWDAYKNNKTDVAIDLTKIKSEIIGNQPPEVTAELNKTVPDTYNLKIREQSSAIGFLSSQNTKYIGIALLVILFIVGVLLAEGVRGRLRTASAFFIIAGLEVLALWYITTVLPVSSLTDLSDAAISSYLLAILRDLVKIFLERFTELFKIQGFWLLGIGIVLLTASFFSSKQETESTQKEALKKTTPKTTIS